MDMWECVWKFMNMNKCLEESLRVCEHLLMQYESPWVCLMVCEHAWVFMNMYECLYYSVDYVLYSSQTHLFSDLENSEV